MKVKFSNKRCNKIALVLLSVSFFGINSVFAGSWLEQCPITVNWACHFAAQEHDNGHYYRCGGTGASCVGGDNNYAVGSGCGCCVNGHYDTMKHGLIKHYCR